MQTKHKLSDGTKFSLGLFLYDTGNNMKGAAKLLYPLLTMGLTLTLTKYVLEEGGGNSFLKEGVVASDITNPVGILIFVGVTAAFVLYHLVILGEEAVSSKTDGNIFSHRLSKALIAFILVAISWYRLGVESMEGPHLMVLVGSLFLTGAILELAGRLLISSVPTTEKSFSPSLGAAVMVREEVPPLGTAVMVRKDASEASPAVESAPSSATTEPPMAMEPQSPTVKAPTVQAPASQPKTKKSKKKNANNQNTTKAAKTAKKKGKNKKKKKKR